MSFTLNKKAEEKIPEILERFPEKRAAVLPLLWLVHDQEGWIPPEAMEYVGQKIGLNATAVCEVVSFYTMFNRKPIGKHHLQICNNLCCRLRNADWLVDYVQEKLGIKPGQSTPDGKFHLSTVECLASCGTAPMMQVGDDYHENLDAEKVDKLLEELNKN
ncbi:MAG: NAD(P)H-dependent oxidoreductase subunit E [Deltaproteobacteria bacterium CG_4_10_14_0_2_um_filter_43_8]|nr:MAG: NAD(P)H-dependent oxidoreductase subunit E [Deltaproteobacteria bacterium CG11_big_fil_rev_8_21_14_0_20_42_23]PJA21956.1 MAG: NAD(P)H-dependent oxidoreductase subunit E [Deltaproteobacteria bacterium CG_4_10_14_0_2_um_filter_43_8]PJC64749.1 MAG: NAD(P)H-dependent oxidoreductase subunit E [Deltaproteobacteria bacterium CG_4_9_14_0_2_um_filter_42_21]